MADTIKMNKLLYEKLKLIEDEFRLYHATIEQYDLNGVDLLDQMSFDKLRKLNKYIKEIDINFVLLFEKYKQDNSILRVEELPNQKRLLFKETQGIIKSIQDVEILIEEVKPRFIEIESEYIERQNLTIHKKNAASAYKKI